MASVKRRKIFFSAHERSILLNLVEARKQIIECKHTDYSTTERKHRAWDDVATDFNAQTGVTMRNSKQLKKCWENAKAKAKKELAEVRRETMTTGRGLSGSEISKPSDDCLRVMAIHRYRYKLNDFDEGDDNEQGKECPASSESMCIAELQDCDYSKMELPTNSIQQDFYRPGPSRIPSNLVDDSRHDLNMNSNHDLTGSDITRTFERDPIHDGCDRSRSHDDIRFARNTSSMIDQEKEHYLTVQLLQEKNVLQIEKHKFEMNLLKLKLENEKRLFKLKEENELRHRKILELQEVFWNSNLRNILTNEDEEKSE